MSDEGRPTRPGQATHNGQRNSKMLIDWSTTVSHGHLARPVSWNTAHVRFLPSGFLLALEPMLAITFWQQTASAWGMR
jgi:hypothetical protein